jgi:hypothetical protein
MRAQCISVSTEKSESRPSLRGGLPSRRWSKTGTSDIRDPATAPDDSDQSPKPRVRNRERRTGRLAPRSSGSNIGAFCSEFRGKSSKLRPFCSKHGTQGSEFTVRNSALRAQNSEFRAFCCDCSILLGTPSCRTRSSEPVARPFELRTRNSDLFAPISAILLRFRSFLLGAWSILLRIRSLPSRRSGSQLSVMRRFALKPPVWKDALGATRHGFGQIPCLTAKRPETSN